MKKVEQLEALASERGPIVFAAGFFDGVHLGHQRVIGAAVDDARDRDGQAWVLTFDRHPARIVRPDSAPPLLMSIPHKADVLGTHGVHGCVLQAFGPELAAMSAEDYVLRLLDTVPGWQAIFVGANWHFGHGRGGNIDVLRNLVKDRGIAAHAVEPVEIDGAPVSSTRVREAIAAGDLDAAERLLGRAFRIRGEVVRGRGLGRELGFPTANLSNAADVTPPSGVYAAWCDVDGQRIGAVLNIGFRPTVESGTEARQSIEAHLLDFDADLYGKTVDVLFVRRLRTEQRFSGTEALQRQIELDIEVARKDLTRHTE